VHPVCNPFGVISCNEDGTVFVQKKKKKNKDILNCGMMASLIQSFPNSIIGKNIIKH